MKKENRNKGNYGEQTAIEYLLNKDYKILEKNFTTKIGEVDIIAKDNDIVVFIEVKLRRNSKYGYPFEAVDYKKQKKIINVAQLYVKYKKLYNTQLRFDIIEVYLDNNYINHISNAFWA
ncbi:YraN family protein [Clostridium sp. D2Q-14]|uniref:YraN family protein n=1 Tax=Anaeromonas gelatinilytica TaxID=2683194 RepID=UPI00193BD30B|nr:YraN family protein [Anaeromonas gelatinilytica]MBS4536066.1 YraN family protein [Anaeromonas gelatinilytica]